MLNSNILLFFQPGFIQQLFSGGDWCGSISKSGSTSLFKVIHEFAASERRSLQRLSAISDSLLTPFQQTGLIHYTSHITTALLLYIHVCSLRRGDGV